MSVIVLPQRQPGLPSNRPPAQESRGEADERLRVLEQAGIGIALVQHRRIARCNQRFAELYGHDHPSAMLGLPTQALYAHAEDFVALGEIAYQRMAEGQPFRTELPQRRRDGTVFWARLTGTLFEAADPTQGSVWIIDDIDAHKAAEAALASVREQQRIILDNAMVGIVFLRDRRVTQCNRAFEQLLGWGPGELEARSSREWYFSDRDWLDVGQRCDELLRQGRSFEDEVALRHRDGLTIECEVRAKAVDPMRLELGSIWITMDISARKASERALRESRAELERQVRERTEDLRRAVLELEKTVCEQQEAKAHIQRLAHYDALTGLPNRALLEDRAGLALAAAQRSARPLALMFLDLDHFKAINDSLGHRAGDMVLVELSRRLRKLMRAQDTVARLGGDEFVLLLPETDAAGAAEVARKVLDATHDSFQVEGHELSVTPSIGIALAPRDGQALDALSRAADSAMYRAKADGRNTWRFYTDALQSQSDRTLLLSNALRRAIERDQLSLLYQPQVELASGRIIGAEALLRWQHSELGAISPAEFIPIAEASGLILPIGEWVLVQAAKQIAAWDRQGLPAVKVAVNVSSVQLRQADLPTQLKRILATAGVDIGRLEVELTEGAAMQDPQCAEAIMNSLYENGTELAVDDFGTGYSSLSYLKRFPIGKVKIDRSFVRDIGSCAEDRALVDAIIRMAASLGMRTVAEGVETEEQLAFLRERGCDAMQGYLVAKPLAPDAFAAFVASRGQTTRQAGW